MTKTLTIDISRFIDRIMDELGFPPNQYEPNTTPEMENFIRKELRNTYIANLMDDDLVIERLANDLNKTFRIK